MSSFAVYISCCCNVGAGQFLEIKNEDPPDAKVKLMSEETTNIFNKLMRDFQKKQYEVNKTLLGSFKASPDDDDT